MRQREGERKEEEKEKEERKKGRERGGRKREKQGIREKAVFANTSLPALLIRKTSPASSQPTESNLSLLLKSAEPLNREVNSEQAEAKVNSDLLA